MGFAPKTIVLDSVTGYIDQGISEDLKDDAKPHTFTAVKYGPIMGKWHRDNRVLRDIVAKRGLNVGVVGHMKHREVWKTTGTDTKGNPIRVGEIQGWQLNINGKGEETIRAAFDEVWHLVTVPNEYGNNPPRKLYTQDHIWEGFPFSCKTRKNLPSPIQNPTWDSVMSAVPADRDKPKTILLLGQPGVGKSTFFASGPKPLLFIDLLGGCDEFSKLDGVRVVVPHSLEEVFTILRTIRDKGELV